MTFAGSAFSEPNTVAKLEDVQRVVGGLRSAAWRIPVERRWILGERLRRRLVVIAAAALMAQEAARKFSEAELLMADAFERIHCTPFDLAAAGCQEAVHRLAIAAAEANEADMQLGDEILTLMLGAGFALHGPTFVTLGACLYDEMTTTEAAAFLACSKRHVQRLARQGVINSRLHPDGSWRHRVVSVADYLKSTKRSSS